MKLFENWQETKTALLDGLSKRKQSIVAPVLEQQMKYLNESVTGGTAAGDVGNFQKIIIPMIRRIIPGTIASEIVGVQPMSGPVGLVYSLRFKFAEAFAIYRKPKLGVKLFTRIAESKPVYGADWVECITMLCI
jgi:hypothetical protein